MHFSAIGRVPGDPILGLMEAYANDSNPDKFDLGVGVFKDAQGLTPIPAAVKLAEQRLLEQQSSKSYVGGHGDADFGRLISELVLGHGSALLASKRAGATQTPGGTGALRLAAELIEHCLPGRGIWLSDPTWPIHETIFAGAGLKVSHYPY
ncbi:MAG: aminotransferase class I/II-fold pyridoxal phosphate-dependent enzyme, partial [Pseudomonas sp.]